jgi:hypothetical protein
LDRTIQMPDLGIANGWFIDSAPRSPPQRLGRQVAGFHPGDPPRDEAIAVARHELIPEVDLPNA